MNHSRSWANDSGCRASSEGRVRSIGMGLAATVSRLSTRLATVRYRKTAAMPRSMSVSAARPLTSLIDRRLFPPSLKKSSWTLILSASIAKTSAMTARAAFSTAFRGAVNSRPPVSWGPAAGPDGASVPTPPRPTTRRVPSGAHRTRVPVLLRGCPGPSADAGSAPPMHSSPTAPTGSGRRSLSST